jgi:hypothetical protein
LVAGLFYYDGRASNRSHLVPSPPMGERAMVRGKCSVWSTQLVTATMNHFNKAKPLSPFADPLP